MNTNHTTELIRLLPSIRVPTLVTWREDDVFQAVTYGQRLAKDIPSPSLVRLADARHFVMINPIAFTELSRNFWDDKCHRRTSRLARHVFWLLLLRNY